MIIRNMTADDADAVSRIEKTLFTDPWTRKSFLDSLSRPEALFLVAENEEGTVCGYCGAYMSLFEADIVNVGVSVPSGGRGTGSALVKELVERLEEKGIESIFLEVRKSNYPARHVYEKTGFITIGTRKDFYDDPKEDAIIMKRGE